MPLKCLIIFTFTFLTGNTLAQDIDSLFPATSSLPDGLQTERQKKTSFFENTKSNIISADSLNDVTLNKIKNEIVSLNQKIDSLKTLKLPSTLYKQKADSLYSTFQESVLGKYKLSSDTLSQEIKNCINELDENIRKKTFLLDSLLTANGLHINLTLRDKFNPSLSQQKLSEINPSPLNIQALDKLDFGAPTIPVEDLSQMRSHLPDVTAISPIPGQEDVNIPRVNIPKTGDLPAMDEIRSMREKISEVTNAVKDAEGYANELEKVKELDVKDMQKVPEAAEKQLLKIDRIDAVKGELDKGDALKKQMSTFGDQAKDPEEMKEEVLHRTKQPFVDYLKGKEEKVQSGMNKMFEYQKKYRVIADTRNLPKRTANKMKGKPWQERLVPGVAFQINQNHVPWTGIAISPFVGYRLSGRFRTFISATYTPYVNIKTFDYNAVDRTLAFRWFTHVKTINGVYVHLEAERKKDVLSLKPTHQVPTDELTNAWQKKYYVGLMRLQRLNKKLNASFYVLYDLDDIGKTFNFSQVEMRFGFEYKLKKKKATTNAGMVRE